MVSAFCAGVSVTPARAARKSNRSEVMLLVIGGVPFLSGSSSDWISVRRSPWCTLVRHRDGGDRPGRGQGPVGATCVPAQFQGNSLEQFEQEPLFRA